MKVSHEVPKVLLNNSREFNDYDYCLPHLLDKMNIIEIIFTMLGKKEDTLLWIIHFTN